MAKMFRLMIFALPVVLFFSYQPLIHFAASESMNFEISLPLLWLVLFDLLTVVMMVKRRILWKGLKGKWAWLFFPLFLSFSVLWSLNSLRGLLTVGILWLIYVAVYGCWSLRNLFSEVGFKETFWKVFFGTSLVICGWCFLQCVLDLVGVGKEYSLMCVGCTYSMFGFPHPNGFAIEPQFMGNLLLAPIMVAGWLILNKQSGKKMLLCFFVLVATLFLTFSRGAIYALVVGMVVLTGWVVWQTVERKKTMVKRAGGVWLMVGLAFLFTLNLQGIMAQISPTNDTYGTGVTKVLNHLSLGVIGTKVGQDVDGDKEVELEQDLGQDLDKGGGKPVENFDGERAIFDGYVSESTDVRVKLSESAFTVWHQDFATALFGAGLGGAGQALYVNGLTSSPKEIVQNQYVSLLLEAGVVGVALCVLTVVLVVRVFWKSSTRIILISLMISYGISLLFFSGLPNALHVYLLLPLLACFWGNSKKSRR